MSTISILHNKFIVPLCVIALLSVSIYAQLPRLRVGNLSALRNCDWEGFTGSTYGAKLTSAYNDLPATGGMIQCQGLEGTQSISSDPFTGMTKNVTIRIGASNISSSVSLTIPSNVTLDFMEGGILTMAAATTATINGEVRGTLSQHFAGSGGVQFTSNLQPKIYPQWFAGSEPGIQFTEAIAALPSTGGIIDGTGYTGAQAQTSRVLINTGHITVNFGCATFTVSGVVAQQNPFGANWLVSAPGVWLNGATGCNTIMKSANGSQATIITFIHGATLGGVRDIELDGNKANNTGQSDDTFQGGIHIISDTGGGGGFGGATADSRITIERMNIHDFIHYGIVTYGNLSGGNVIQNNQIYNNGKVGDVNSTGDGVYINRGSSRQLVQGNQVYSNKKSGIRLSTAAAAHNGNRIINNWTYSNTIDGIQADEESVVGSVASIGQTGLLISGNHTYSNTGAGIHIVEVNNVGFIRGYTVMANAVSSNVAYGILVQSSVGTSGVSDVSQGSITNNVITDNTLDGIFIGSGVLDTYIQGNIIIGNSGAAITNNGTRTRAPCNIVVLTDAWCNTPMVNKDDGTLWTDTSLLLKSVTLSGGAGTITLTGDAPYSSSTNYTCFANDTTAAANAVTITHTSGSVITLAGTSSDVIMVACLGLK